MDQQNVKMLNLETGEVNICSFDQQAYERIALVFYGQKAIILAYSSQILNISDLNEQKKLYTIHMTEGEINRPLVEKVY